MANQNLNQKRPGSQQQQQQQNQNWNQKGSSTGEKSTVQPADKQPKKQTNSSIE